MGLASITSPLFLLKMSYLVNLFPKRSHKKTAILGAAKLALLVVLILVIEQCMISVIVLVTRVARKVGYVGVCRAAVSSTFGAGIWASIKLS